MCVQRWHAVDAWVEHFIHRASMVEKLDTFLDLLEPIVSEHLAPIPGLSSAPLATVASSVNE